MSKREGAWQGEILAIMRKHETPVTAYALLNELREINAKIAPPTVYRALSGLTERGLVHRLESLNAFMACKCDGHASASVLSICDDCGNVDEQDAPEVVSEIATKLANTGFAAQRHVIEVHGTCASCGTEQPSR
ncbi:MAG: Fur family transcriptional regulator [Pseudomonadota bacterium]